MKKAKALGYINSDGPRASLRKMKIAGISSLFVIDKGHQLKGIIYAEDCSEAASRGERDIKSILKTDLKTVQADTPAMDIINLLHDLPYPLAVVDDMNRIRGVINRGALLGAIAERGVN
jgi:glycine betaine/proline transport system ATP-binding protein